jgi:hypothetical protein
MLGKNNAATAWQNEVEKDCSQRSRQKLGGVGGQNRRGNESSGRRAGLVKGGMLQGGSAAATAGFAGRDGQRFSDEATDLDD